MNNPELYKKFKSLNQVKINEAFISACEQGDVNTLDYLLYSKELNINANGFNRFAAALGAVESNSISTLQYLVHATHSIDEWKPYIQNKYVLDYIRRSEDIPMITYLIMDLNIEKTQFMQEFLEFSTTQYRDTVAKLFQVRDLSTSLKADLDTTTNTVIKKNKI